MGVQHESRFNTWFYKKAPSAFYVKEHRRTDGDLAEIVYYLYKKTAKSTHSYSVSFRARPLPGCCGVLCVYYLAPVSLPQERPVNVSEVAKWIEEAALAAGYGMVIYTQKEGSPLIEILVKQGFADTSFTNGKTGTYLHMFHKVLPQQPKAAPKPSFDAYDDD